MSGLQVEISVLRPWMGTLALGTDWWKWVSLPQLNVNVTVCLLPMLVEY